MGGYRSVYRLFRRLVQKAELHDVRFHDLRHTYGVHSAQAGVPLPRLQRLLGHSSVAMTMRYASHAPGSYFAEDAAKIAASMAEKRRDEAVTPESTATVALKLA